MNHKLEPSQVPSPEERVSSASASQRFDFPPARWEHAKFFRSRFVYDPELRFGPFRKQFNWNAVWGIGLATVVSIAIWTGIGLMVAYIWK